MYRYPLLGDDSIAFLPASINFQEGNGLVNNVYSITRLLNEGKAEDAFVNYPPVFPLVNGVLLFATENVHLNAAIIHIILMLVFAFFVKRVNSQFIKLADSKVALFLLVFFASWNTQLNPGEGRPEPLAQLFLMLLCYNTFFNQHKLGPAISGLLITIIGFTHPVTGIYSLSLSVLFLLYNGNITRSAVIYVIGGISGLVIVWLSYPYSFQRLLEGIREHGKIVAGRSLHSIPSFFYYHLTSPNVSFYFFAFLMGVAGLVAWTKEYGRLIKLPIFFLAAMAMLTAIVLFFTFQTMEASYNLYVLFPVFGFFILYLLKYIKQKVVYASAMLLLFTGSVGYARRTLLFPAHISSGMLYEDAREMISKIDAKKITVTASLYSLPPDIRKVTDNKNDTAANYLIYQQNFSGLLSPPEVEGYELLDNKFIRQPVKVAGIKIASSPPGYQFALYRKVERSKLEIYE